MARTKKKCPGCPRKFKDNVNLVKHMNSSQECQRFIVVCPTCGKQCADDEHLKNHQKQRQKNGHMCYDPATKLDIVSTLELKNLKSTPLISQSSHDNNLVFAVEQKIPHNNKQLVSSIESLYGSNNRNNRSDIIPKYPTPSEKIATILNNPLQETPPFGETICQSPDKRNKIHHSSSNLKSNSRNDGPNSISGIVNTSSEKVLFPQNDVTFLGISNSEKETIVSKEVELFNINHKSRNFDVFKGHQSDGKSYNVCVPVAKSFLQAEEVNQEEDEDNDDDLMMYYEEHNLQPHLCTTGSNSVTPQTNNVTDHPNSNDKEGTTDNSNKNTTSNHSQYIYSRCEFNKKHYANILWEDLDSALIDLYNMHKKCRAPIGLFDDTLVWLQNNSSKLFNKTTGQLNKLKRRTPFVNSMYTKVYGKDHVEQVKPSLLQVNIPDLETSVYCTVFDFREVMVSLLSNKSIMDPNNLIFYDDKDPTKIHPVGCPISSVVTSDVFRLAHKRLCTQSNDVLWPLAIYNDEINVDNNGKLCLDPLSVSFLRLSTNIRNQAKAWRTFGMVHSLESNAFKTKDISPLQKIQVHHQVLRKVYQMIEILQKEGNGIPWKLQMKDGSVHDVNLKIYIQFVIGDTKGHDQHCGRLSNHNVQLNQCVRDCHVPSMQSDNVSHICKFRKICDLKAKSAEHRKKQSFHDVDICYDHLDLGDNIHGIYGATCGEPLHMLGMGLDPYLVEVLMNHLCADSLRTLEQAVINIVPLLTKQSASTSYPRLSAFRNGIKKINILTSDEKFARLFIILIALLTSDCAKRIATNPTKRVSTEPLAEYGTASVQKWIDLLESMLGLTEWLKQPVYPAHHLYNEEYLKKWEKIFTSEEDLTSFIEKYGDGMATDSPAQKRIIKLLEDYHKLIGNRTGNGLKLPKFHLMLHIVRNIIRHGPVINYDTGRSEANAKETGKSPGLRTQMHHKTISYQTAIRNHEDLTIQEAEQLFHDSCEGKKFSYFVTDRQEEDKSSVTSLSVIKNSDGSPEDFTTNGSSKFILKFIKDNRKNDTNLRTSLLLWSNKTPNQSFDTNLLMCLTNWLWVDIRGGCISEQSIARGFTEIQLDGNTYRAHPSYRNTGPWYDWAFVEWEGSDHLIPARIFMFFELNPDSVEFLCESDLIQRRRHDDNDNYEPDDKYELLPGTTAKVQEVNNDFITQHRYWAIIHSAENSSLEEREYPTEYHMKSSLCTRVKLESQKYRMIPISSIKAPALAVSNQSLVGESRYDNTAIIFNQRVTWAETFLSMS